MTAAQRAVAVDGSNSLLSLYKILGKHVVDIHGYVDTFRGERVFQISCAILDDGSMLQIEGEHDCPYLEPIDKTVLESLDSEMGVEEEREPK